MSYTPIRSIREILESIFDALQHVKVLSAIRGTLADIRVSITGGSVAVSSGTITTVTGVTTLANQTSVGGYTANPIIPAQMNTMVALGQTANISVTP